MQIFYAPVKRLDKMHKSLVRKEKDAEGGKKNHHTK